MNARRPTLAILASLCATAGVFLLGSAPALAARGHVFGSEFGEVGAGPGELSEPQGVAVNEASGDVYVVDEGNHRVERFSAAGAYLGQFNGSGTYEVEGNVETDPLMPPEPLSEPESIAVDNSTGSPSFGDVYIADSTHNVIDKFSSTGEYIGQLAETSGGSGFGEIDGVAVDSNGELWVFQSNEQITPSATLSRMNFSKVQALKQTSLVGETPGSPWTQKTISMSRPFSTGSQR
jgi:DNA-binding beta-propeller fold protein YncE